jgi:hypothetical protein
LCVCGKVKTSLPEGNSKEVLVHIVNTLGLSFRIFIKGANVTIVELRVGEDTASVFSSAKCWGGGSLGVLPQEIFYFFNL